MKPHLPTTVPSVMILTAFTMTLAFGADKCAADGLPIGEAELFLGFPEGNSPEGIAIDGDAMYVSNRFFTEAGLASEILKINPEGKVSLFTTFDPPTTDPFANGILGLAVDPDGDVFAAVDSRDPATHGVWRVAGKKKVRITGSEGIFFPNALTFDAKGNLYVTESLFFTELGEPSGAIWRFTPKGTGGPWIEDALLGPLSLNDPLLPPVGANGIAFYPPNHLYVANTQGGWIVHIAINPDGSAGDPEIIAAGLPLLTVDGIAVDAQGQIHAVVPGFAVLSVLLGVPLPPVVKVDPATGAISRTSLPEHDDLFDFPLSVAFAGKSVFVTNGAFRGLSPVPIPEPGPGVVEVGVGVPGFPGK